MEPTPTVEPDPVERAAAQATALVQEARATALVLEARAQATALVRQALQAGGTPTSAVVDPVLYASPTPSPEEEVTAPEASAEPIEPPAAPEGARSAPREPIPVQIVSVSYAADGGMIMVNFLAAPKEAEKWWPGNVSVTDEGNGAVYNEIPVLPKIGPLIGRPKVEGQPGYVMLMNAPPWLQPGALVTVVLGAHTFEHIVVQ